MNTETTRLLKFYATWCGPCKALEKRLKELKIPYVNIDVETDDGVKMAEKYKVQSVPTLVLVSQTGAALRKLVGAVSIEQLKDFLYLD